MQINPHYLMARRRAERYERLAVDCPTYARKQLALARPTHSYKPAPKIKIGSGRVPGQPIELMPAIHTPPPAPACWSDRALYATCAVVVVMSSVFVGW